MVKIVKKKTNNFHRFQSDRLAKVDVCRVSLVATQIVTTFRCCFISL